MWSSLVINYLVQGWADGSNCPSKKRNPLNHLENTYTRPKCIKCDRAQQWSWWHRRVFRGTEERSWDGEAEEVADATSLPDPTVGCTQQGEQPIIFTSILSLIMRMIMMMMRMMIRVIMRDEKWRKRRRWRVQQVQWPESSRSPLVASW